MPAVIDVSHQQRIVELDTANREGSRIVEVAGVRMVNLQCLNGPSVRSQFDAFKGLPFGGIGIPERAAFEEV